MQTRRLLAACAASVITLPAYGVTYEVGPGKPYATIQDAVNAAAAAEGQPGHVPNPTILIHTGVYNELVEVPFDPDFSTSGAGVNDGWQIKAAPGAAVKLNGHMIFMFGRENFLIEGLVIDNSNSSNPLQYAGINFHGGTTRGNTVRNCVVYGVNNDGVFGNPAVRGNFTYGVNTLDQVTLFNVDYGITANTDAWFDVRNSIVVGSNHYGIFSTPGSASSVSHSNFFGNVENFSGNIVNGGNNPGYPVGVDPLFVSTDATNPYFLWLRPDSPMIGAGEGGTNLGGRPVFEPIWDGSSGSNWSTAGNWVADFVPNAVGMSATLPDAAATKNLVLDVPVTLGRLTIDSAAAYTVAGAQTLTIQAGGAAPAQVTLVQGSHAVTAAVRIASDAVLSGGGTLKVASLAIDSGKALDVGDEALVVDYSGASPRAALEALVAAGFAGGTGAGTGIRSSLTSATRAVGIAEAGETGFGGVFNGHTLDSTSLIIRYTLLGDADLSGSVNIGDFSRLGAGFNLPGRWATGDFNLDGTVGIGDFSLLAANFNQSLAPSARGGSVPEPTCGLLLANAAALLVARRRR